MINISERKEDILQLISSLDISATMYKNADEKYHALASYLEESGINAEIYPQGSFALGTVVRPLAKDPDAAYDLDFICQVDQTSDQISPSTLRKRIESSLEGSRYSEKLKVYDECFTIEFADVNGVSFTIDIVPAADETTVKKQELMKKSSRPDLLRSAIAIPCINDKSSYDWLTNNPRGFKKWFDEINQPYLSFNRDIRRKKIFEENRAVFASIDDIPDAIDRSTVQRVIQIMKYHRDVYYSHLRREDSEDLKPISAIINVIVASIAKSVQPQSDVFELLSHVLSELMIYSQLQSMRAQDFCSQYGGHSLIARSANNGKWNLQNPADPDDNLANKWNENPDIPKYFFLWVNACSNDLIESLRLPNHDFRTAMSNAFGANIIQRNWGEKYTPVSEPNPKPILTAPKPYHDID